MKTLEPWGLRMRDSDACWYGFNGLRPAKTTRINFGRILFRRAWLGLPACLLALGTLHCFLGRVAGREIWGIPAWPWPPNWGGISYGHITGTAGQTDTWIRPNIVSLAN